MSGLEPKLCFVDTNVWLYAFIQTQDQGKSAIARTIIQSSEIVVSSQVINEVCVNLIKKARFDEAGIRNLVESFYSKYRVAGVSQALLIEASELRGGLRFYGRSNHSLFRRHAVSSARRKSLADYQPVR